MGGREGEDGEEGKVRMGGREGEDGEEGKVRMGRKGR